MRTGNGQPNAWRAFLLVLGAALVIAAVLMEIDVLTSTTTKTETTEDSVVTTVTAAPAPSGSLVTGTLGLGVACLLIATFLDRIKKVSVAGVDIELDAAGAGRIAALAVERVHGDAAKVEPLVTAAIDAIQTGTVKPSVAGAVAGATGGSVREATDATYVTAVESAAAQLNY